MRLLAESKLAWIVGPVLGIAAIAAIAMVPEGWSPIATTAGILAIFGAVAALGVAILQRRPFTVALLVAAPLSVSLVLSVLFAGNIEAFVRHDALILTGAIAGAFAGAFIGARVLRPTAGAA